jgi:NAD(P)-dependent dehydrogenase (short-subunit alcohol dehydrogenase family)
VAEDAERSLEGRRVLVTGGSMGIGREVALAVARAGGAVVVAARGEEAVEETVAGLPGAGHRGVALDVGIEASWESAVNDVGAPLHGVVAAAGVLEPIGPVGSYPPEEFLKTVQTDLYGTYLAVHHCLPALREAGGGSIVTFSGGGATSPMPRFDAYAASKAAVVRLTENLAPVLTEDAITINAIAPGFVATRMQDAVLEAGSELAGDYHADVERQVAEGGTPPEAAAELAVFLLSPETVGISGKLISAQWDPWRDASFRSRLADEPAFGTLRRIDDVFFTATDPSP